MPLVLNGSGLITGDWASTGNISLVNLSTNQSQVALQDVSGCGVVLRNPTPTLPAYLGTFSNHDLVLGYGTSLDEKARI